MFNNNFINNIVRSMMALCVVANGWSDNGGVLVSSATSLGGSKSDYNEYQNRVDKRPMDRKDEDLFLQKKIKTTSPIVVNTDKFGKNGSSKPDTACSGYNNTYPNNKHYDIQNGGAASDTGTTSDQIFFPNRINIKRQKDFLETCKEYSINDTTNQIICALNALSGSEFVEFYELNNKIINDMQAKDFASLSDCLYEQFDEWRRNQDICKYIQDKIIKSAIELGLLKKSNEDKVTDFKMALMALGEYLS